MRNGSTFAALIAGIASLAGCNPTYSVAALNTPPRALKARPIGEVEMFTTSKPSRPFVEVGTVSGGGGWPPGEGWAPKVEDLRKTAADYGCDGLIMTARKTGVSIDRYSAMEYTAGLTGVCIVYREPEAPAPR